MPNAIQGISSATHFTRRCVFRDLQLSINMPQKKRTASTKSTGPPPKSAKLTIFFNGTDKGASKNQNIDDDGTLQSLLIDKSWKDALKTEMQKPYFAKIQSQLEAEYKSKQQVFPQRDKIFNAFNSTPLKRVKVVLIGQDPYHDDGQANGLCFSVERGVTAPPSLKNIYKELLTDIPNFKVPNHGSLQCWADRGVFLLNATLTVRAHQANSHAGFGWQTFTDAVIKIISQECDGVVFILWGGFAKKKAALIDKKKHRIIEAAHPSPLSVSKFLGCKCFSKANQALVELQKEPVDWHIND